MERNIWGKAVEDSTGLKDYYKKHQQKYLWDKSADVLIFTCTNENTAEKALKDLANHKSKETIVEENVGLLQIDSGRYEINQIPLRDKEELIVNNITQTEFNKEDGTVVFVKTLALYPENLQRSFEEARGIVISDYQNLLEEKWLVELKKKYPVKVSDTVFKSL
jgi:peptidyl-prolyl cis-trans isomerase SurA